MWRIFSIFILVKINLTCGKLSGDHICLLKKEFLVNVTETFIKNATVRNYHWCYNVPPRCSFYTVKQINNTSIVKKNQTRNVETCCPGFIEKNHTCISSCPICINGICDNGYCNCSLGYKGDTCNLECSFGEWGPNCLKRCDCHHNTCDSKTGLCLKETTMSIATIIQETTIAPKLTIYLAKSERTTDYLGYLATTKKVHAGITIKNKTNHATINITPPFFNIPSTTESTQLQATISTTFIALTKILPILKSDLTTKLYPKNIPLHDILPSKEVEFADFTTKESNGNLKINSTLNFSITPIATKEGLLIPVKVHYEQNQKITTFSTTQDKHYVSFSNEEFSNRQIPNTFFFNEFTIFGITVLVALMLVVTILSIIFLRKKRKRKGLSNGKHQVSLFSTSIFHSPLPDPPVTENPLYLNPVQYLTQNGLKEFTTFESIEINAKSPHLQVKDNREFEYDYPLSTESYRAAFIIDLLEKKKNPVQDYVIEPLYDEIPQNHNDQNAAANLTNSSPMSIYINTCGKTKF